MINVSGFKTVSWNSVHFKIPVPWQPIIKDRNHLIFEQEAHPVIEIRWDRVRTPKAPDRRLRSLFRRINHESGTALQKISPPSFLAPLANTFEICVFSHRGKSKPVGALLICRQCGIVFLVSFFDRFHAADERHASFFTWLDCDSYNHGNRRWTFQDITFNLPEDLTLETFSISFGTTTLHFQDNSRLLVLCRLAPASGHLSTKTLPELFSSFSGGSPDKQTEDGIAHTLSFSAAPNSYYGRIINRIRRKKAYRWARFNHLEKNDRILGALFESSVPLDFGMIDKFWNGYGLIQ